MILPLLLHMISVLPPRWTFRFIGSEASIALLHDSASVSHFLKNGKVKTTLMPPGSNIAGQEAVSAFMTTLWLWNATLGTAEHVLVFQTDSIICANAHNIVDDYLEYDWIGAPWRDVRRIGGNGGLSLRRVAPIVDILSKEERKPKSDFEDVWFTKRLQKMPGVQIANRSVALTFSGEGQIPDVLFNDIEAAKADHRPDPRTKFEPMGYHLGNSGDSYPSKLWGTKEVRQHVWDYCPEVKLLFPYMDAAQYMPGDCNGEW